MSKRLEDNVSPGLLASLDQLRASTGAIIYIPLDCSFADIKHARIPPADLAIVLRELANELDARVNGESRD
ncbi:hypothetical protein CN359_30805 [Bacillus thuringiensis]|uniref:hypothetical protein n=1 Tax=Bacillus thuringiensis TaxID=1428 RepID=UPI000BF7F35C|nr:hypothetical protein [Bacillus thuringiensis]PEY46797.1 hypothetical protein CN359_30805 [Bacillus thuringiensis]